MKKEARILEYLVYNDVFVGLVKRDQVIEHVIIEHLDEKLPEKLLERPFLKEVRKVVKIEVPGEKNDSPVISIIKPETTHYTNTKLFHERLAKSIKKLEEVVMKTEVLP